MTGDTDDFGNEPVSDRKKDHQALTVFNIMVNEHGRKFMWDHLQECGVFDNVFNSDPIQHSYQAGLRAAGLRIELRLKQYEPEYYIKMIRENMQ